MTTATPGEWQTTGGDQSCSGSCPSGACTTSCTNMHAGPAGTGPVSAYSYNITSPHGASYMTAVTPQSFVCSASGPLNLGQTLSWSGVHFHVGSLTLSITGSVGSWDVSGGPGYTKTGAGGSVTIADVPSLGSENYTVKITATPGQIVCVSQSAIANCSSLYGTTQVGVGGLLGPDVISTSFTVPHHGTKTVYIRSQAATAPQSFSVGTASPMKLYNPVTVSFTNTAPRAYITLKWQKSGGGSEGNADDCVGLSASVDTPISGKLTDASGNFNGTIFTPGEDGPLAGASAIGCWKMSVRVDTIDASPLTYLPGAGLKIYAGTLLARATVNNG
ncbi:MAG: hypothetical protein Q8Q39_01760, partial [bacterium]|nr:hypothetical protein [bacterium]